MRARSIVPGLAILGSIVFSSQLLRSQTPDSARWRIYITATDSVTGRAAKADFGFHPRATIGLDSDTMFGFKDHWYASDSPFVVEYPDPPVCFCQEVRINNVRERFPYSGLIFGNIHRWTDRRMVDTFIVTWNSDVNRAGDSAYLFTHPQILSWPSVLQSFADSIILRDISDRSQTTAGNHVHVDMTKDSSWTFFGDNYFDPDRAIYTVDPLNYGFFVYVYHPKVIPNPPSSPKLLPAAYGADQVAVNAVLQWEPVPGAYSYNVQVATEPRFRSPMLSNVTTATSQSMTGLAPSTTYYWRVSVTTAYGVSYFQDPPGSFKTGSVNAVKERGHGIPSSFNLYQNYPNPFNPSTRIEFSVPASAHVSMKLYDELGRAVATLVQGDFGAGYYSAVWNAADRNGTPQPSGIYFARLEAEPLANAGGSGGRIEKTIRLVVLK